MEEKNVEKIINALKENPTLAEKLSRCKSVEEAYALCGTISGSLTLDECREAIQMLLKSEKLTDTDLENVSGGGYADTDYDLAFAF
ncbi:MAG: hypothetical protein LUG52_03645 [Clostridia bacterium]|nr:hypothetical protein [Clostridia bacterium]